MRRAGFGLGFALVGLLMLRPNPFVGVMLLLAAVAAWPRPKARSVIGHSHGGSRSARHEAGHVAVARGLGGKVHSATLRANGSGWTEATLSREDPQAAVAFLAAGRLASGTRAGCASDDAHIAKVLREVPRRDRAQVRRAGEREARSILSSRSGEVRRVAVRLQKRGRL